MESALAIMPAMPGEQHIFAVAEGCAGDPGDDAEDRAQAVVDPVNGIADPSGSVGTALVTFCQQLFQERLWIESCAGAPDLSGKRRIRLLSSR